MNDIEAMRAKLAALSNKEKLAGARAVTESALSVVPETADQQHRSEAVIGLMIAAISLGDIYGLDRSVLAMTFAGLASNPDLSLEIGSVPR